MKVLFVSSANKKNRINTIVYRQGESLKKEGLNIQYFSLKGKGLLGYVKNVFTLRSFLSKNKFDVIHAHYGLCGIVSLLAKRKEKLIVSLMGDDILGSRDFVGKSTSSGKIFIFINQIASKFYNYIIVKSEEMKSQLNFAENKIQVIPNGVDFDLFYRVEKSIALEKINWTNERINLLFLGDSTRPEKNYKLAFDAVELLKNKFKNLHLHVVNNQPTVNLKFYYSASNVLLLPSFHEGSPNVIKEAMSCNCVIVATNVGDIKWLFGNTPGYYLSTFDVSQFSVAIENAIMYSLNLSEPQGKKRIVELALGSKDIAQKIINVYKKQL